MGKPTGFMEYDRCEAASVEPKERIKNFNEFHVFLSKENQQKQAARCMDCGVPFCQSGMTIAGMTSGCPLHNLVRSGMTLYIPATGSRHIIVCTRPIISLSLHQESARHCARRHVHVDTGVVGISQGQ